MNAESLAQQGNNYNRLIRRDAYEVFVVVYCLHGIYPRDRPAPRLGATALRQADNTSVLHQPSRPFRLV
mgnify:CR=1 FL=1